MIASPDWWKSFFSGIFVDFWLQVPSGEQTQQEADFLQKMLPGPPARLLDVPCGGGRHARALAARGYQMTGVDISTDFLRAAQSSDAKSTAAITWEQRDMRDLPWTEAFDGAFSFGNSFGYYEDEGNANFLQAVARTLRQGTRFVVDTSYLVEVVLPTLQERAWFPVGDILFLAERHYDPVRGRLEVEYTLIRDGKSEKRSMSARLYTYREFVRLLEQAGFTVLQGYGSLNLETFQLGSKRLLLVSQKPASG